LRDIFSTSAEEDIDNMSSKTPDWKRNRTLPHRSNRHHVLRPVEQPKGPKPSSTPAYRQKTSSKSPTVAKTGPFPFFDLPGEIRNRIYDLAIPETRVVISGTHPQKELEELKRREPEKKHKTRYHLRGRFRTGDMSTGSLLFASRQFNKEALQYVYARTTFCFEHFGVLRKFLRNIPTVAGRRIRSMEITHVGYAEPQWSIDRAWKLRHDARWAETLEQVKTQTNLQELTLDITNFDWPIQLELNEPWARPLLHLAGEKGLDRVRVKLDNDAFEMVRCDAAAKSLERRMMTSVGRQTQRREEAAEKQRELEANRKAKKVLRISLPQGAASSFSGPVKNAVKSKGLEGYAVAEPSYATC
jgi:hypothetical protein